MPIQICSSCRQSLRLRLRQRLDHFRDLRRSFHITKASFAGKTASLYWSSPPPTPQQLEAASWFFETFRPKRLWTAEEWRKQNQPAPELIVPEVAFLGRSNVGKSSILNALLNKPGLNPVGPRPGKTIVMTAWGLSPTTETGGALPGFKGDTSTRLTVLDVPGYGFASQGTWGAEITKYLSRRKHLRKVFVLVDASHGLVARDKNMFELLRSQNIPHQVIASKADALLLGNGDQKPDYQDTLLRIAYGAQTKEPGELLVTGARRKKDHELSMEGIADLRWSLLRAVGLHTYAYECLRKHKNLRFPHDEQKEVNSPNPFKLPPYLYKNWIGGSSEPVMGGIPFLAEQDHLPGQLPPMSNQLPSSHPRAQQRQKETPPSPFSLRHGLDTLLSPDQLASQIRAEGKPLASPPPSPPADPRSRTATSPTRSPSSTATSPSTSPGPSGPQPTNPTSTSSAPRGIDALMSLIQPKSTGLSTKSPSRHNRGTGARPASRAAASAPPAASRSSAPSMPGPGVSRGLDAFISATQPKGRESAAKARSSGGGRRRRW